MQKEMYIHVIIMWMGEDLRPRAVVVAVSQASLVAVASSGGRPASPSRISSCPLCTSGSTSTAEQRDTSHLDIYMYV